MVWYISLYATDGKYSSCLPLLFCFCSRVVYFCLNTCLVPILFTRTFMYVPVLILMGICGIPLVGIVNTTSIYSYCKNLCEHSESYESIRSFHLFPSCLRAAFIYFCHMFALLFHVLATWIHWKNLSSGKVRLSCLIQFIPTMDASFSAKLLQLGMKL